MRISLKSETPRVRKRTIRNLRILFATYHAMNVSADIHQIATTLNVSPKKIEVWEKSEAWRQASEFWNPTAQPVRLTYGDLTKDEKGSLNTAERYWSIVIEKGLDLSPRDMETEPELNWIFRNHEHHTPIGLESITLFTRFRDVLKTAPIRLKYWAWGLYVSLFV